MEFKSFLFEEKSHIAVIRINRPEKRNAFDSSSVRELCQIFERMHNEPNIRCVILTCAGDKAFCTGADIQECAGMGPLEGYAFGELGRDMMRRIEGFRAPVIAAINGYALGGGAELALSCDMRIAADTAKLGTPEVTLCLLPAWSGSQKLPRTVGKSKAKEMMMTGDAYTARQALEMGLVDRVVPAAGLMDEALALAEKIASRPPVAVAYIKTLINDGLQCDLNSALRMEGGMAAHLFATEDNKEACAAFLEKRPHREWQGR